MAFGPYDPNQKFEAVRHLIAPVSQWKTSDGTFHATEAGALEHELRTQVLLSLRKICEEDPELLNPERREVEDFILRNKAQLLAVLRRLP